MSASKSMGLSPPDRVDVFARNLRELRCRWGFTQRQLAANARVSVQAVRLWEKGKRAPSIVALFMLADALVVDPMQLLLTGEEWRARLDRIP